MTGEDAICVILANGMLYAPKNEPTATLIQDAFDTAIKALEKQIPRKPIEKSPWVYHCSNCDSQKVEEVFIERFKYCRDCGQALDWSETDD